MYFFSAFTFGFCRREERWWESGTKGIEEMAGWRGRGAGKINEVHVYIPTPQTHLNLLCNIKKDIRWFPKFVFCFSPPPHPPILYFSAFERQDTLVSRVTCIWGLQRLRMTYNLSKSQVKHSRGKSSNRKFQRWALPQVKIRVAIVCQSYFKA